MWTQVNVATKEAYSEDAFAASSSDNGKTWTAPVQLNQDRTASEHSFISLAPFTEGEAMVIWLDGRQYAAEHRYALMAATISAEGKVGPEKQIDNDVCTCCPTSLIATKTAYRDHTPEEIRDILFAQFRAGIGRRPNPSSGTTGRSIRVTDYSLAECSPAGSASALLASS